MNDKADAENAPTGDGLPVEKRTSVQHPVDRVIGILRESFDIDAYIEEIRGESSPLPITASSTVDG